MPTRIQKASGRRVKVFKNGRNRAVRIPREFEFAGDEAIMRKVGAKLIIEPVAPRSLLELLASLKPLDEDFAPIPDSPPEPVDL
jgi:antitoxin VapB